MKSIINSVLIIVLLHFFVSGNTLFEKISQKEIAQVLLSPFIENTPDPFVLPILHSEKPHFSTLNRINLHPLEYSKPVNYPLDIQQYPTNSISVTGTSQSTVPPFIFNCILRL